MENQNLVVIEKLTNIVKNNEIEQVEGQKIIDAFGSFYQKAVQYTDDKDKFLVSSVDQEVRMVEAGFIRKDLKKIRLDAEKSRKFFKEGYLNKGRAVDAIAKLVEETIEPLEDYYESQEKYAENIEKEKVAQMVADRTNALKQYTEDISIYKLNEMTEESYTNLLNSLKDSFDKKNAELALIEEKRIADEKAEKEENERVRIENEKLKEDKRLADIAKAKEIEEQRLKDEEKQKEFDKIQFEKDEAEFKLKAKEEEEKRAIKLAEANAKRDAELAEENARMAQMKPEKDKLFIYAEMIKTIEAPKDLSKAGLVLVTEVEKRLLDISQYIKEELKNL